MDTGGYGAGPFWAGCVTGRGRETVTDEMGPPAGPHHTHMNLLYVHILTTNILVSTART